MLYPSTNALAFNATTMCGLLALSGFCRAFLRLPNGPSEIKQPEAYPCLDVVWDPGFSAESVASFTTNGLSAFACSKASGGTNFFPSSEPCRERV